MMLAYYLKKGEVSLATFTQSIFSNISMLSELHGTVYKG